MKLIETIMPEQNHAAYPVSHPLHSLDDLDRLPWPDPQDPECLSDIMTYLEKVDRTTHLIQASNPGALFVRAWLIMGMEPFLIQVAEDPDSVIPLLDRITDFQVAIA